MVVAGYFPIVETPDAERRVLTIIGGSSEGFNPEPAWSYQVAQRGDSLHFSGRRFELLFGTADYYVLCRKRHVLNGDGPFLHNAPGCIENLDVLKTGRLVHLHRQETLGFAARREEPNSSVPHSHGSGRRASRDSNGIALADGGRKLLRESDLKRKQERPG
jgi:hypothetical protein